MNWRLLLPLPLAALVLGSPVAVPKRLPEIPVSAGKNCAYAEARKMHLLAWAYRLEQPGAAGRLARGAVNELGRCEGDVAPLLERARALSESISP